MPTSPTVPIEFSCLLSPVEKKTMKNTTTYLDNKSSSADQGVNSGRKIKRVAVQVDASKSNLAQEIKRLFDMAKSAGQELDLTFCHTK